MCAVIVWTHKFTHGHNKKNTSQMYGNFGRARTRTGWILSMFVFF